MPGAISAMQQSLKSALEIRFPSYRWKNRHSQMAACREFPDRLCALLHTIKFRIPVLSALRPVLRQTVLVLMVDFYRNRTGNVFVELSVLRAY